MDMKLISTSFKEIGESELTLFNVTVPSYEITLFDEYNFPTLSLNTVSVTFRSPLTKIAPARSAELL